MPEDVTGADRKNFTLNDARQIVRDTIWDITKLDLSGKPDTTKLNTVRIKDSDTLNNLKNTVLSETSVFLDEKIDADIYFEFQDYGVSDNIKTAAAATKNGVSAARANSGARGTKP